MPIVRDRELVENWDETIPAEMLESCIKEHMAGIARLNRLDKYYQGAHKILERTLSNKDLPNNKIVANHAKYIADVATGYFIGEPVKYEGGNIEPILEVFDEIDIDAHDAELAKDLSVFGRGYELYYMSDNDNPIPKVALIDPRNIFLVVDDTVDKKQLFACHYYAKKNLNNEIEGYRVNVYTASKIFYYEAKSIGVSSKMNFKLIDEQEHFFDDVPVVEYKNNEEAQGDFEQQITLIDAYNLLMSDRVNDKEQLVDALLVVLNASLGDDVEEMTEMAKFIKEHKMLELPEGADAKWLIKNLNEQDVELLRKAIRDDIHQFSMVPNLTDEKFAMNASGVAMAYKLFLFEQLMKIKERFFKRGLKQRLKLFANVLDKKGKVVDLKGLKIIMSRSLPVNLPEIAQMIATLDGKVSLETLLAQLPFVEDPAAEAEKVEEEKERNAERNQRAFGFPMDGSINEEVTADEE